MTLTRSSPASRAASAAVDITGDVEDAPPARSWARSGAYRRLTGAELEGGCTAPSGSEGDRSGEASADGFSGMVGRSRVMAELFDLVRRVAPTDASVLVHGETGTGKELVARAIHASSRRAEGPFVVVDCGALPEHLLDAELFGHARGAFTGAVGARTGAIEAAHGGTLFLDEIGELPPSMQPKLLRALEARTVRRVGESSHRAVDVRFVAATHRDLGQMIDAGSFREDLYFRLAILPVTLPPLRDRVEDIPLLAAHVLGRAAAEDLLTPDLLARLMRRPWRGNVRELRNVLLRAAAMGVGGCDLDGAPSERTPSGVAAHPLEAEGLYDKGYRHFREALLEWGEAAYVRRLMKRHGWSVAAAAAEAGVDRTYLYRLVRRHGLGPSER